MVTVLSARHLKYKINENDHNPPHVHVEGCGGEIRINLLTLEIMDDQTEFSKSMIRHIQEFVRRNRIYFLDRWEQVHGEEN
jgi:hypothetical protein